MTTNEYQKMWKEAVKDKFKALFGISMQWLGKTTRNPVGTATLNAKIRTKVFPYINRDVQWSDCNKPRRI